MDLVSKSCDSAFVEPCIIISIQKMSANYFNFKDVEYLIAFICTFIISECLSIFSGTIINYSKFEKAHGLQTSRRKSAILTSADSSHIEASVISKLTMWTITAALGAAVVEIGRAHV